MKLQNILLAAIAVSMASVQAPKETSTYVLSRPAGKSTAKLQKNQPQATSSFIEELSGIVSLTPLSFD